MSKLTSERTSQTLTLFLPGAYRRPKVAIATLGLIVTGRKLRLRVGGGPHERRHP